MLLLLECGVARGGQTDLKVFYGCPAGPPRFFFDHFFDPGEQKMLTSTAITGRPVLIIAVCLVSLAANSVAFNTAGFQTIPKRFSPALRSTGSAAQRLLSGQAAACKNDGAKAAKWSMQGNSLERRDLFALGTGLSKCIVYSRHIFHG
jgi:hypothetical protein